MGAGAVVVAMYVFRRVYKLENYITELHFDKMGKITVMLALLYLYFNVNEFLVPAFKMKKEEKDYLNGLFTGDYSLMFWFAILVGMIIPIVVLIFKKGRKPMPMFIVGVMIVIGAWFKRYLIVTPTLLHPFLTKIRCTRKVQSLLSKLGRVGHYNWFYGRRVTHYYFFRESVSYNINL